MASGAPRRPSRPRQTGPPRDARLAAGAALLVYGATLALLVVVAARRAGDLLGAIAGVSLFVSGVWIALTNRRWRLLAIGGTLGVAAGTVAALQGAGAGDIGTVLVLVGVVLSGALGAAALRREVDVALSRRWHAVPGAAHPVLLMNPQSGGGKVARFHLVDACAARNIDTVVLDQGCDLHSLAQSAVLGGADVIGMAGGDGSQAVVAAVAASHGVAYVCVPAGTRNHLALDLGVERDDVVGALDAFGPALESSIDLASVNGRMFVNNVSLGLYGSMVASADYREEKLKTAAQTVERRLGPDAPPFDLHIEGPDGPIDGPQIVEVSNNPYTLSSLTALGSRPRLDTGSLGAVTVKVDGPGDLKRLLTLETAKHPERFEGLHTWSAFAVEVRSASPVPAGIDGEAATLEPPLRFRSHPRALRVRVARGRPRVSAAMQRAPLASSTVAGLWALVTGRPSGLVV